MCPKPSEHNRRLIRDLATNESTLQVINNQGTYRIEETATNITCNTLERYTFCGDNFPSLRSETYTRRGFSRADWNIEVTTRTLLTCTIRNFHIHAQLDAYEGDLRVYLQNWQQAIAREYI